ncbi:hypothetical protein Tco_0792241 [Tanacetum coccineum]
MVQLKVLMDRADDDHDVGKNHARNSKWIDITMRKTNILLSMDKDANWRHSVNEVSEPKKEVMGSVSCGNKLAEPIRYPQALRRPKDLETKE